MEQTIEVSWRDLSYAEALGVLNQLRQAAQTASTVATLVQALTLTSVHQKATLAFLFHVFDPAGEPKTPDQGIWEMMPLLINSLNDSQIAILFNEILFTVRSPAVYKVIAVGLRRRVKPADCEAAILKQLERSDRHAQQNARELAYYVFGWEPDYWLSEAGQHALERGV